MFQGDELIQYLESQKSALSHEEYLDLLLSFLEENPSKDMLQLLGPDLLAYAYVDRNRVANQLAPFLLGPDPFEREKIVHYLYPLARRPDDAAYKILHKFLGEEPTRENLSKILSQRFEQLRHPKKDK